MSKYSIAIGSFLAVVCAIVIQNPSFSEPANLGLLKQTLRVYHDSGDYQKEFSDVVANARRFVDQKVAENRIHSHPEKLAIVLDIDETSLSNYKAMASHEYTLTHAQFRQTVHSADAPPFKEMLSFYKHVLNQGVAVFFVTARAESQRNATIKNLELAGYHHWKGLYFKPMNYKNASNMPFKSKTRSKISHKGYTIIASIGDQYSDLKGGYAEKTFKLPNPYYYLP